MRGGGEAGDVVPLGAVVAPGVAGVGAEAERALGDGGAAAFAGGAGGLGVLDGNGRLGGRRGGRHCGAGDDAGGGGEERGAGVSGEEGGEEHAMWGWTGGECGVGWGMGPQLDGAVARVL